MDITTDKPARITLVSGTRTRVIDVDAGHHTAISSAGAKSGAAAR